MVGYLEPGCSGVWLVGYRSFRRAGRGPLAVQQRPARPALLLAQGLSDAALVGLAGVHRLIELLRNFLPHRPSRRPGTAVGSRRPPESVVMF
ncbi:MULTISPECIES: hypothetical protein [Prochlorococcus]|uniref:hypothetical protein n=1 Tax=Prochlorococcus TaxID=1218 RepID=UPI001F193B5D|nr:hypothetical protein [Prochlorococcus marinus]